MNVLFQDNHLLVVAKPSGVSAQGDASGKPCLLDLAKAYRKERESKPGKVFVGLVHRLDRPVSGVMVFAKTSKGASRLSEQFREGTVQKRYLAIVERLDPSIDMATCGVWRDLLCKGPTDDRVNVVTGGGSRESIGSLGRGCQSAVTEWRRLESNGPLWLLELRPRTGRRHQLRVQTSFRGLPIVGDRKYGSTRGFGVNLALHAVSIEFLHPTKREPMRFTCPVPESWRRFGFDVLSQM